jgi:hypothetical protein
VTVERIRAIMLEPRTRIVPPSGKGKRPRRAYESSVGSPHDRQRNPLIVSMLAYAGLRPVEDRSCPWREVHDRTLHVYATKTGRARDIDLVAPPGAGPRRVAHGVRPTGRERVDHPAALRR